MKKILLTCLLALSFGSLMASEAVKFTVYQNPYCFSTYFELMAKDEYCGRVIRPHIRLRTCYELYDAQGEYEGEGICRAFSLGSIYSWARAVDLYDDWGNKIGLIDGKMLTTERAKFNLYGVEGLKVARAYLDANKTNVLLMENSKTERLLGHLTRKIQTEGTDVWEVSLYDPTSIDLRILKLFAAFLSDHTDSL